ncbi:hypothetical protein [Mesomycoplasma ovipneumoniae]
MWIWLIIWSPSRQNHIFIDEEILDFWAVKFCKIKVEEFKDFRRRCV